MRLFSPTDCVCAAALMMLATPSSAQNLGFGSLAAHMKFRQMDYQEEIHSDSSSTRVVAFEQEALSSEGVVHIGRFNVSFNADLESVEIVKAYTTKQDGQIIPVLEEHINKQKGVLAPGTQISMPGKHVIQITFPNVQKGDRTYVAYRHQIHKSALPNTLSNFGYISNELDFDALKVQISAPKELDVRVHAQGLTLQTQQNDARQYWTIEGSSKNFAGQAQSANVLKRLPFWMYSTAPSRTSLGERFTQAMRKGLQLTPEIQELAQTITLGKNNDAEKAQAIYQWIAKEIRYVAIFLGSGGFVPNEISEILRNRYGDCKDQTLLMMALLQAVGIEAAPALINTGNADWLPPVAATSLYNHVIVYIPGLSLYADPTAASTIPFGALPLSDTAKPVLVGLAQGVQEMQTPAFAPKDNHIEIQSVWKLDAQGQASVQVGVKTQGHAASELQGQLSQVPEDRPHAAVERILKKANLSGKGTAQYAAPIKRDKQEQDLALELSINEYVSNPDVGSINPHPSIAGLPLYIQSVLGAKTDVHRRFDMLCPPVSVRETFELHFPEGMQLLSVPKGVVHKGAGLAYSSSYEQKGNIVMGQRTFERLATQSGHICTVQEVRERHPLLRAIRKDLDNVVLYKAP